MGVESPQGMPCILRLVNRASAGRRGRRPLRRSRGLRAAGCGHPALRSRCGAAIIGSAYRQSLSHPRGDSSCCGAKILCSLNAHRILTAATRSPRCLCPRQRSARSPLSTREPLARRGTGDGAAGTPPPTKGREMRIATSAYGLLRNDSGFCHSEERSDLGIRSFSQQGSLPHTAAGVLWF